MGEVWRVFDAERAVTCALKVSKHSRNESQVVAAIRESSIWYRFRHVGHVVEVYEILRLDSGKIGILMEYVEGGSLREALNADVLTKQDKLLALYDVTCALMNCEELSPAFCHLDLKPENCLRTTHGLTKLTDFGLASSSRVDLSSLASLEGDGGAHNSLFVPSDRGGICAGTPQYMAPEQILGLPTMGGASDVYALGVLAVELLCGRHPLLSMPDIKAVFQAHLQEVVKHYARLELPRTLGGNADLLVACLAADPAQRPTIEDIHSFFKARLEGPPGIRNSNLQKFPEPVDETTRTARSLYSVGEPKEAIALLRRVLDMDPSQADSWALLAKWLWEYEVVPALDDENAGSLPRSVLIESCVCGLRALLLDNKRFPTGTEESTLMRIIIPQAAYQLAEGGTDLEEGYRTWWQQLLHQQSQWLADKEEEGSTSQEAGGESKCLCVRCGEIKMYLLMRCPRCGFLPVQMEDIYFTNIFKVSNMNQLADSKDAPYSWRLNLLRAIGKDLPSAIENHRSRTDFQPRLSAYARGQGAVLHDLANNGPSADEIKRVKQFVRHVRRQSLADWFKKWIGISSSE